MSDWEATVAILGLAVLTLLSRAAFLLPGRALEMPTWATRALRHAPLAALVAICIPEIVMVNGELIGSIYDARVAGALAATAYFAWRRGILGTLLVGMAVFLPLRIVWGW